MTIELLHVAKHLHAEDIPSQGNVLPWWYRFHTSHAPSQFARVQLRQSDIERSVYRHHYTRQFITCGTDTFIGDASCVLVSAQLISLRMQLFPDIDEHLYFITGVAFT